MKRLLLSAILNCTLIIAHCQLSFAQSPQSFSFQAVVRDGSGDLVTSSQVGMRISLLQGSASGTAVYVETHTPTTNANGLASLQVGGGSVQSGTFASIDWADGPYFIKSETDPNGGTAYSIVGTQQLNSVPYALFAANGAMGATGPTGPTGLLTTGSAAGNTPYWNGSEWVTNSSNIYNNGGNVGVRTSSPAGNFHVRSEGTGAETLDQQQTSYGGYGGNTDNWQSFTAGLTGSLTKVELQVGSPAGSVSSVGTVRIYSGQGTGGALLSTTNVTFQPVSGTYQSFPLAVPASVYAGNQYTIRFSVPSMIVGWVDLSTSNPYAGGQSSQNPSWDFMFKTYVVPIGEFDALVVANGKVGIGTVSPSVELEVAGKVKITGGSPGSGKVLTSDANGLATWQSGISGGGNEAGNTSYWNGSEWVINSNIFNNGGNVGIGTNSPSHKLDVDGSVRLASGQSYWIGSGTDSGNRLRLHMAGSGHSFIDYAAGSLNFRNGINTAVTFSNAGNVGIGTPSPSAKLEVDGQLKITGGSPGMGKVLTSDANGLASWLDGGFPVGSSAGNTAYWNGTEWVTNSSNIFNNGGNVGIKTSSPTGTFHVNSEVISGPETVDQQLIVGNASGGTLAHWQSFTAGITGKLTKVELGISSPIEGQTAPCTIRIYSGEGTGGTLLSTTNGTLQEGPTSFQSFTLSAPSDIVAGNQYTIEFSTPTVSQIWVRINTSNPYAGGRGDFHPNWDFPFKTHVMPVSDHDALVVTGGNVGIGTATPIAKLEVAGQLKITGGSPGAGKVLVSDASGLASWSSGPVGPTGPAGPSGANGAAGPTGPTGLLTSGSAAGNTPYWNGTSWVTSSSNIFNNGGNVGIGTTPGDAKLHVAGEGRFETANGIIRVTPTGWRTADRAQLKVYSKAANPAELDLGHTDGGIEYGWQISARGSIDNRRLQFYSRNDGTFTPRLAILHSDGNVGIGTISPVNKLQITGGNLHMDGNIIYLRADPTDKKQLIKWNSGTDRVEMGGFSGVTLGYTDGAATDAVTGVLNVSNSGNVGIGTAASSEKLEVVGKVMAEGYRTRTGTVGPYTNHIFNWNWSGTQLHGWIDNVFIGAGVTSDRRLKDRINPLTDNAIGRVMALRPVDFYYKKVEGTIFTGSDVQQEGFIADELQAVIPSAVTGEKGAVTEEGKIQPQTVNVTPIISVLTKAVQEQQEIIEQQRSMIESMRTENGLLRSDVNALKASLESIENKVSGRAER